MRYEAILFDLDGVLVCTDKYHYQAWKAIADELGIPFDQSTNQRLRGVSRQESFDIILEKYNGVMSPREKLSWTNRKNELYRHFLSSLSPADLSTDVRQTLDTLRNRGMKLAVGSSSKNAHYILERLGLDRFFDAVTTGNDITHSKPNPEVFLKAANFLGIPANHCLVVEDAAAGLQAAASGGMDSAAFGGSAAASGLSTWNLRSLGDLVAIVDKQAMESARNVRDEQAELAGRTE